MLDELLGRGLSSKCKPLIKVINSRLDTIRRKRNCTLRLLRTDVADLLTHGQEMKAFDRAEVLIAEQNRSTAYDMVEQFCASIFSNLPALQKQRECPPESMEAVASLMFAAARFADLPELRNLRGIFSERYGIAPTNNAADLYTFPGCAVNKEFAEMFSSKPPSTDRKLKLMREISKESSIKWDSKAFEERVNNPHASNNVAVGTQLPQLNDGQKHGDDVCHEKVNQDQLPHRKTGTPPEYAREKNVGHDPLHAEVHQGTKGREESDNLKSRIKNVKPPYVILTGQKVSYSEDADSCNDHQVADYPPALNTKGEAQKEMKPNHNRTTRPPPYVVSIKGGRSKNGAEDRRADAKYEQDDEFLAEDDDSAYRHPRTLLDSSIHHERQGGPVNRFEQHREAIAEHDTAHRDNFPKPASVRQRHPQAYVNTDADDDYPPPHHMKYDKHKSTRMVLDHGEDDVPEAGYSRNRHKYREKTSQGVDTHPVDDKPRRHHRRPVQHLLNEEDDEDKIMDELLLYYSQKVTPRVENDIQVGSKPPTPPIAGFSGHTSATRRSAIRAGSDPRSESSHAPNRAASLPPEQWQPEEEVKLHVRATSMQPDMCNGHVHPKLPDYDDLAERFAALRRQSNG